MTRPLLLDLFCGAGGCAAGYHEAGFTVVGIDLEPQPRYPYEFIQGDALDALALIDFTPDVVHASPPCQAYSTVSGRARKQGTIHVDLVSETRDLLQLGFPTSPYVMENVPNAPLKEPVRLCGSSFGLDVRRHRIFETNWPLDPLPCDHSWQTPRFRSLSELTQAVPPAYTEYIGRQLLEKGII